MTNDLLKIDLASQSFMRNPFPTLAQLRAAGPVVRIKLPFLGSTWVATTYAAVQEVLKDDTTFVPVVVWREVAERLLEMFRGQDGRTRGELEDDQREAFGDDPGQLVHQGLAKLLEDRCEFETVSDHPPEELRPAVFRAAAIRPTTSHCGVALQRRFPRRQHHRSRPGSG